MGSHRTKCCHATGLNSRTHHEPCGGVLPSRNLIKRWPPCTRRLRDGVRCCEIHTRIGMEGEDFCTIDGPFYPERILHLRIIQVCPCPQFLRQTSLTMSLCLPVAMSDFMPSVQAAWPKPSGGALVRSGIDTGTALTGGASTGVRGH